jgi:hypothetical protein
MPRKKKAKQEDSQLVANFIYKVMTRGDQFAKQEIICKLILQEQVEFLEQIRLTIGDDQFNRALPSC